MMTIYENGHISLDGESAGLAVAQRAHGTDVYDVRGLPRVAPTLPHARYALSSDAPSSGVPGRAEFERDLRAALLRDTSTWPQYVADLASEEAGCMERVHFAAQTDADAQRFVSRRVCEHDTILSQPDACDSEITDTLCESLVRLDGDSATEWSFSRRATSIDEALESGAVALDWTHASGPCAAQEIKSDGFGG